LLESRSKEQLFMADGETENERGDWASLSRTFGGEVVAEKKGTYGVVYIVDFGEFTYPRMIAYKTFKPEHRRLSENQLDNFVREAWKWFQVKGHGLILTPFYIRHAAGVPLICMPFCGMDLQDYMEQRGTLDLVETLVLVAQILKALLFAEGRGIKAHQDLKPANILLEDLGAKFVGFPPEHVHGCLRYGIRVADFGLADAWREIGKPQGPFPYAAPEQYAPDEYHLYDPDIFAVGVIMTEMLTGLHPCGKRTKRAWKDWSKHRWKEWAAHGERCLDLGDGVVPRDAGDLIYRMLRADPQQRPSKDDALSEVMELLHREDADTAMQLDLQFEYYDTWAEYMEEETRLDSLATIAGLEGQLDHVIEQLLEEVSDAIQDITTPRQAVVYCKTCRQVGRLLLDRGGPSDGDSASDLGRSIVDCLLGWLPELGVRHVYPPLGVRGHDLVSLDSVDDWEIQQELLLGSCDLYRCHKDPKFHYLRALVAEAAMLSAERQAGDTEDYSRAQFQEAYATHMRGYLLGHAKRASELDPDWEEPSLLLAKYGSSESPGAFTDTGSSRF
jgi:serine/threonine protein kinase